MKVQLFMKGRCVTFFLSLCGKKKLQWPKWNFIMLKKLCNFNFAKKQTCFYGGFFSNLNPPLAPSATTVWCRSAARRKIAQACLMALTILDPSKAKCFKNVNFRLPPLENWKRMFLTSVKETLCNIKRKAHFIIWDMSPSSFWQRKLSTLFYTQPFFSPLSNSLYSKHIHHILTIRNLVFIYR